jgi:hypothetical protein
LNGDGDDQRGWSGDLELDIRDGVKGRSTDGIMGLSRIAGRHWAARCRAAVAVMTTTATVSVNRTGPSVLVALRRRPVVAPGAVRLRRGEVVDLLAGVMRAHGLAAWETLVVERGRGAYIGEDDWWGLGSKHGGGHAGSTSVVGHVGLDGAVCPFWDEGGFIRFAVEWLSVTS